MKTSVKKKNKLDRKKAITIAVICCALAVLSILGIVLYNVRYSLNGVHTPYDNISDLGKYVRLAKYGIEMKNSDLKDMMDSEIKSFIRSNATELLVGGNVNDGGTANRPVKKGDDVMIINIGKKGMVVDVPDKDGNVTVQAGIIKTRTKVSNLMLLDEAKVTFTDAQKKQIAADKYRVVVSRDFSDEIDLRGLNGDDAWYRVDKYFDEAHIAGIHVLRLIHGKGTGALKNALWAYLKRDNRVASFRIGQFGEGDGGVTVVELK